MPRNPNIPTLGIPPRSGGGGSQLALRYVERGTVREFYAASVAGGVAAGLKLTAGVSAVVVGWAFVLRARREDGPIRARLSRPRLLATGTGLGVAAIICSYPSVLVGDPAALGGRLLRAAAEKSTSHGWRVEPSWWWVLRGYLHGLGLALTVAAGSAVLASLTVVRKRSTESTGIQLALVATAVLLAGYSRWAYVRTHHLLLTFPLLVLVVAVMAQRLRERQQLVARALVALLLVTSGAYAVGGDLAFAAQPRDAAADWLADRNGTVETYVRDPQEAPVPHDGPVSHSNNRTVVVGNDTYEPGLRRWTLAMPERCPEYVVLTHHRALLYLAPEEWGKRAEQLSDPVVKRYVSALLAEDTYPYEVAATFGRRPRYLDGEGPRSTSNEMAWVGVRPRSIQYGDPQDFGIDQYTVILARTGSCDPTENSPFRSSA